MTTLKKGKLQHSVISYTVVFQPESEGGYTVAVPSLPGCITYGKNLREAKRMAKEAIELYIEDMADDEVAETMVQGQPIVTTLEVAHG